MLVTTDELLSKAFDALDNNDNICQADLLPKTELDADDTYISAIDCSNNNYESIIRYDAELIAKLYNEYFTVKLLHWFTESKNIHNISDDVNAVLLMFIDQYAEISLTKDSVDIGLDNDTIKAIFTNALYKTISENSTFNFVNLAKPDTTTDDVIKPNDSVKLSEILYYILNIFANAVIDVEYCAHLPDAMKIARKTVLENTIAELTSLKYLAEKH